MKSVILKTVGRFIIILISLYALFLLFRGHNLPGGGFIAGLVTVAGITVYTIAFGKDEARKLIQVDPQKLLASGLGLALTSGFISLLYGKPFMTGIWYEIMFSDGATLPIGTPVLFDLGVYLVVIGSALIFVLTLEDEM